MRKGIKERKEIDISKPVQKIKGKRAYTVNDEEKLRMRDGGSNGCEVELRSLGKSK